jgi:hypothetical protein
LDLFLPDDRAAHDLVEFDIDQAMNVIALGKPIYRFRFLTPGAQLDFAGDAGVERPVG